MEKIKKVPERKCVGCNEHKNKTDLWRVVKTKDGDVSLDKTGRAAGRGAYICKSAACLKKAAKAHRLEAAFQMQIPQEVYASLEAAMAEGQE